MISEMNVDLSIYELPEPENYYEGVHVASRPVTNNALCFVRRTRQALQQQHLSNRMHHRHVLLYASETGGIVSVEGKSVRVEPGEALLVLPHQFHHYISLDEDRLHWIFVTFELAQGGGSLRLLSHQPLKPDHACLKLWDELLKHWKKSEEDSRSETLPILDHLLMRLCLIAPKSRAAVAGNTEGAAPPNDWIAKVESLVIRSISEGLNLESVAQAVGISSRHLRTRFEEATGVSLRDYRSGYQLSRAIALMQNTNLRLGEIAELCGFNSQPVFNRFISRHAEQTPNKLRAELRSDQ